MRILLGLPLWFGLLAAQLPAGTIQFQETNLGQNVFRYTYLLSGFSFQSNQELEIRFNPSLYGTLSNGVAGSGFVPMLLQPNNPPGDYGIYSAFTAAGNPSPAGPFSVDFVYLGAGQPGSQPFFINQYDAGLNFVSTIESGFTTPAGSATVPEPASLSLAAVALLLGGAVGAFRRRSNAAI